MSVQDVIATATDLIAAFEENDRDAYFAFFQPEARFIFHNVPHVLESRAAYEAEYDSWVRDHGFAVLECSSFNQHAAVYGDTAIFSHQLFTRTVTHDGEVGVQERETIVFVKTPDGWKGVHEHLSLLP